MQDRKGKEDGPNGLYRESDQCRGWWEGTPFCTEGEGKYKDKVVSPVKGEHRFLEKTISILGCP